MRVERQARARWPVRPIYYAESKKSWRVLGREAASRAVGPRPCEAHENGLDGPRRGGSSVTHCFPLCSREATSFKSRTGNKGGLCNSFI